MSARTLASVVLFGILILAAVANMAQTLRPGDTMQLWEYRTEAIRAETRRDTTPADPMLNARGQQGWELIAMTRREVRVDDTLQTETIYTFKRLARAVNR
jgi:hypothetical protein